MERFPSRPERLQDRAEAGLRLAAELLPLAPDRPVIVALPRGGVPVAAEIARSLGAPLDVLVVRKIGAPGNPEYGLGAVAEGGYRFLDHERIAAAGLTEADLAATIRAELREVARRAELYRRGRPRVPVAGRTVVVVDDGVATGGTMIAAVRSLRVAGAGPIVVALGVCPRDTLSVLEQEADRVVALLRPVDFFAVGEWYAEFDQVSDAEVIARLHSAPGPVVPS